MKFDFVFFEHFKKKKCFNVFFCLFFFFKNVFEIFERLIFTSILHYNVNRFSRNIRKVKIDIIQRQINIYLFSLHISNYFSRSAYVYNLNG